MCVTDRHDMTLVVKVALNPNTTNQSNSDWLIQLRSLSRDILKKNIAGSRVRIHQPFSRIFFFFVFFSKICKFECNTTSVHKKSCYIYPITRRQILDSSKLKESADDNFKFDENGRKFSKRVENTIGKREIPLYEQFLFFPQCFQKACFPGASNGVIVWEWVKMLIDIQKSGELDHEGSEGWLINTEPMSAIPFLWSFLDHL